MKKYSLFFKFKKMNGIAKKMMKTVSDQEESRCAEVVFCLFRLGHMCVGGGVWNQGSEGWGGDIQLENKQLT